ncbi:MAG: heparan-alpha-glucosaminide N-acetyltransferase domain-containing protein [Crocinitomicaceae bacterium]|nr:heparan-alpha-glucosaminide N-acetyltransferase domain-containing protein [Crocinitomicaceae bacterium]MDG1777615.1 heparan-alpha-glucosaminide N-acetyltransferase domain-containing protein [Crocinitomicaceae bacterium]
MHGEHAEIIAKPKVRLKFIDMARSFAILLMLEGHFIEHTFSNFKPMIKLIKEKGTSGYLFFDWWYFMKGFTAPLFFVVTGVVFVYLLARNKQAGFAKNPRVQKGFKRALELLFWGYMLQLNLRYITNTFNHEHPWIYAFHVLQSIGVGIIFLLLIFGLYKLINKGPLYLYYFLAGTIIFCFYPSTKQVSDGIYFPVNAPQVIQNIVHGPRSVFAIIPWIAFTLYGGMVGALIIRFQDHVKKYWFSLTFIGVGVLLNTFGRSIGLFLDDGLELINIDLNLVQNAWLYGRMGQVFIALGVLMLVDRWINFKGELFLKIGQNTLPIYIIHVVILYGGIFGFGLNQFMKHSLSGVEAILGAALFIGLFVVFINYFEFFDGIKKRVLNLFKLKKYRN